MQAIAIQAAFYYRLIPDPPAGYFFMAEIVLAILGILAGLVGVVLWRLRYGLIVCVAAVLMCAAILYVQFFQTRTLWFL